MVKLNVQKISEKEIVIALLDAGMDTEKINEFIESINSEYFQKSKNILFSFQLSVSKISSSNLKLRYSSSP